MAAAANTCHRASLDWAELRFSSMLVGLAKLGEVSEEIDLQQLLANVDNYRLSIGDIEQQSAGFDEALDPLLRRNASPPCRIENRKKLAIQQRIYL